MELLFSKDGQCCILDDNFNMVSLNDQLKPEHKLFEIMSKVLKSNELIDLDLLEEPVLDIYMLLVEKVYKDDEEYHKFYNLYDMDLNEKVKTNLLIAFNKFFVGKIQREYNIEQVDYM